MNITDRAGLPFGQHPPFATHVHAIFARAAGALGRLGAAWRAWREHEEEMRTLRSFTDRDLWDLGLCRGDVAAIEKGLFSRE